MTETKMRKCVGKGQYPSHGAATAAMHAAIRTGGAAPHRLRVYPCEHCNQFHYGHVGKQTGRRRRRG